jgi:hypothetical protein
VAADEIFVLALVALCAGILIAMAVNSRRRRNGDVEAQPVGQSSSPPVPDAEPVTESRRRKRRKR